LQSRPTPGIKQDGTLKITNVKKAGEVPQEVKTAWLEQGPVFNSSTTKKGREGGREGRRERKRKKERKSYLSLRTLVSFSSLCETIAG
jgi:hypothetical protein